MKALELSSRAAALSGPNTAYAVLPETVRQPDRQRRFRPDDDEVHALPLAQAPQGPRHPRRPTGARSPPRPRSRDCPARTRAAPPAARPRSSRRARVHARRRPPPEPAWPSRPPDSRVSPAAHERKLPPLSNIPEYSVGEVSAAVRRNLEAEFPRVRVRGEVSGFKRAASGHLYFNLKDDRDVLNAVCWRGAAEPARTAPGRRHGGRRDRAGDGLWRALCLSACRGRARPCWRRGAAEAAGGAPPPPCRRGAVRRGPQAAHSVPAGAHRHRHLARRGGAARYPAPAARALPPPCAGLARAGAGRGRCRADCRRHRRHGRRWRRTFAPGRADRGARRRLAGGSVGLQRGSGRARGGARRHAADLGGRP